MGALSAGECVEVRVQFIGDDGGTSATSPAIKGWGRRGPVVDGDEVVGTAVRRASGWGVGGRVGRGVARMRTSGVTPLPYHVTDRVIGQSFFLVHS
jgi:hypothetical protein